ncbi:MAG: FIST C-terminal domain-containing protein [Nitrospirae bacterium]|nr:FIST C-terminal domain-containing protein [Nitrospirota bacterium]
MKIEQNRWKPDKGWQSGEPGTLGNSAHMVLVFGSRMALRNRDLVEKIQKSYPRAQILGCSTAGEICGTEVSDDSLVMTAVRFDHTEIRGAKVNIDGSGNSFQYGERLAQSLQKKGLRHVFVISEGLNISGSELVDGLSKHLPPHVTVTGGLSGDGALFKETIVLWNDSPKQDVVAVLGFYGDRLKVGYGAMGGWDPFGPERLITRSKGNVLYEIDGKSALDLYKNYLGEHAKGLPGTALHFPLSLRKTEGSNSVVRTILSVDEQDRSMIFAGDVPQGVNARLMRANFERLIDGSADAARTSYEAMGASVPELALLISCVGRKLVLKQRTEEEVEGVREVMGDQTVLAGFYSYGGISPFAPETKCEFHNQSMTITTFSEN